MSDASWRSEARRLLILGMSQREVSRTLGVSTRAVGHVAEALHEERPSPSLPVISLLARPLEETERTIRFAPKTRLTSSPGAERWREIHQKMIRSGRIRERGLVEEMRLS